MIAIDDGMKKPAACPLGKYEWSRVVAFCGRLARGDARRQLQALACASRGLSAGLGRSPAWVHAAAALGRDAPPEAARAIVLESVAYRATRAAGLYLNSLLGSGLDVRPFDVALDDGFAFALTAAGDATIAPRRRRRRRRPATWRRFSATASKAGLHTEVAGAVRAGRDDAGLPGGAVFCALRERSATGDFWNPAQSNPYGTEVCPCEYRGFVVGAAVVGLCGFTLHPLCERRCIGCFALRLPDAAPRAGPRPRRSWARCRFVGAGVAARGKRMACETLSTYAMKDGAVLLDDCAPLKARLGDAGDVGRWGGAVLALEKAPGTLDAGVFGHLRLQQPFDRETGPPRRNSTAVPLRGALTPGAGGSWRLWATTDRGGVGTALRPSPPARDAAPSSPAAEACRRLWGDAAFGFDLSVAPRDGATFELTATLDADFSTITAVFRHNEGHPSFATTDGALALAFEEEWDPG